MTQLKKRVLSSLLTSKEVYTPVSGTTTVVLSSTQQSFITNNTVTSIAVYLNGLRMDEDDDYTYNSSTYTFTFDEAFEGGEKVTVVLSYIDDSATDVEGFNSDKYEKPIQKSKVYSTFSSSTISLEIDKYSLFVLDFRTTTPSTLTLTIPNVSGDAIGKVFVLSMIMGSSSVPVITWGNNIVWNSPDYTAPDLEVDKAYNISFLQANASTKYIGNVNSEFDTDDLVISSS